MKIFKTNQKMTKWLRMLIQKFFLPNCKLPCTSLQAKAEKTGSDYCLAQLLEFWSRTFIRQPFEICLCNFQCCYLFELCILCAVCVHLNVVGSRYANLALLCILLPHELPPCVCTKFGVQNDFGVIFCTHFHETFYYIFHSSYD